MRRLVLAILVLAVVFGGSWIAFQATAQEKEPPPPDYEVYVVSAGDLAATVSATGSIEPTEAVNLTFRGVGPVDGVFVEVGDPVLIGQVLARLDTADLQLALEQAQIGKRLAEANLTKAKITSEAIDIAAAEAAVEAAIASADAARAAYQDLLRGPTAAERRATQANEKRARVLLDSAQRAYDDVSHLSNVGMLPQALQLEQATIDYEVAKANVETTLAAATAAQKANALAQIASAESAIVQAEAALDRLKRGPSAEDLVILQIQVDQAGIAIKQAELAMENAVLVAPIDSVVGAVNIRENETPNPALSAIVLTDDEGFNIKLNVDEIDIGQLAVGQEAIISIDAIENAELTGVISRIAPVSGSGGTGSGGGIVTYGVTVDIDPSDIPLRAGLTAAVVITTEQALGVVLLPNRVMRLDRQTGQAYVEKLVDGIPTRTNLEMGLRNELFSEVLSGVQTGDELAVRRTSTGELLQQQMFGG
ncbi:MAG: HlyD family efflux transporter periplasmic adaptor subunit [Chloroflexi bacterium]|nr:HlyD family efflux transporter periplasmic adaptor subunit [Chloroflexota bacterium]